MRTLTLLLLTLLLFPGCKHRSLVCTQSDPDWYAADKCASRGRPPFIELAFITKRGRPLKGRRVYVLEVNPKDSCSKVNANGLDLVRYSNALIDARLTPFLITDKHGRARITFDEHRERRADDDPIWSKGPHLFRFSRAQPPRGPGRLREVSKLDAKEARRSAVVRVDLCDTECIPCSGMP